MINYFKPNVSDDQIHKMSSLALAHIGDGVFEILTRTYLLTGGLLTAKTLHQKTISCVKATAQAKFYDLILEMLTEHELDVLKRGRNAKPKGVPKSASHADYAKATALEALFGYLFLKEQNDRINELFDVICKEF